MAETAIRFAGRGLAVSPPLSVYIHLPWCVKKCPYCDFNSHAAQGIPEAAYIDALLLDLERALPDIWGRTVHTVFFGGGTPSLFSAAGIDRILSGVRTLTPLMPGAEITLEANPGTVEAARFAGFREAGVTRLSLGIQSFNPRHLKALGRIHGDLEARRAAELAATHFDTFNLDLMFALPTQTLAEALADVDTALAFRPPHLSAYHLTLEPNTPFGHTAPPNLPDDDLAADMQQAVETRVLEAGMQHYETSAYAKPGHASRHNLNYWQFGDYLGIGAGAHSKLSFRDRIVRQMRTKHPQQYMDAVKAGTHIADIRILARDDLPFEFMMNALRLNEGVPATLFEARTGLPLITCTAALERARARGLLEPGATRLQPTLLGQRFLNDLLAVFLPDEKRKP
ncbi:MAG: YggW family oxidoreductase [Thiobacillus sp. 63-78]|uniref:radical SAM family heme chaperone HemW n=1 Tax=Thiobacillus sp. 63-78 TaxID=1895859 RepID=UPI00096163FD|nr:radical SAM family heme chaperone HemW [Thiobacillus sp. 63-78]MBN8774699.1 oxygen-independent coproporphyrinogen III oxidase-like protein [Thiobacillus sp.]OJZ08492.1 MAG: YggW family oxidoreductase [Thiobacillus sp. 63-78]